MLSRMENQYSDFVSRFIVKIHRKLGWLEHKNDHKIDFVIRFSTLRIVHENGSKTEGGGLVCISLLETGLTFGKLIYTHLPKKIFLSSFD